MASYASNSYQRNRAEINRMSEDDVHYESCEESDIIEAVNSVNTTNEVEINTNVYDESSCDEIDSFVKF